MKHFLLLAFLAGGLTGCHSADPAPSRTGLLTAHTWGLTAVKTTYTTPGSTPLVVDDYAPYPCLADNSMDLQPDDVLLLNTGATRCDITQQPTYRTSWYLSSDEQYLLTDGLGNVVTSGVRFPIQNYTIVELTASTLWLRLEYPGSYSKRYDYVFTAR